MVVGEEGENLVGFFFDFAVEDESSMFGKEENLGGLELSNTVEL